MIGLIVVVGGPIGTGGAATGAEEATVVMPGVGTVETELPYMDHEPSLLMPLSTLTSAVVGIGIAVGM